MHESPIYRHTAQIIICGYVKQGRLTELGSTNMLKTVIKKDNEEPMPEQPSGQVTQLLRSNHALQRAALP